MKKIIYFGGYYSTNIGNGFYAEGIKYLLNTICSNKYEIHYVSDIADYYWQRFCSRKMFNHIINVLSVEDIEYIVIGGPMLTEYSLSLWEPYFSYIEEHKKGIKVVLLSAGGGTYSNDEITFCKKYLNNHRLYALITRDSTAYEHYKDYFDESYNGICNAFFIPDYFIPLNYNGEKYIVSNFETSYEPRIIYENDKYHIHQSVKIRFYPLLNRFNRNTRQTLDNKKIIRTKHTIFRQGMYNYGDDDVFFSDCIYDYLNIYSNAECVFTDRVHACVATLALGGQAQLFNNTARNALLDRVGASSAKNELTYLNMDLIKNEKNLMKEQIEKIIK